MKTNHKFSSDDCIFSGYYHKNNGDDWCGLGFGYKYSLYKLATPNIYLLQVWEYTQWDGDKDVVNYYEAETLEGILLGGEDTYTHSERQFPNGPLPEAVGDDIINSLEKDEVISESEADTLRASFRESHQKYYQYA